MGKILKFNRFNEAQVNSDGQITDIETDIFDEFPEDVLKTLEDNYSNVYVMNFNWNEKTSEFGFTEEGNKKFHKWWEDRKQTEFIKQLNKIITLVREDLLTIRREKLAKKKLESFEELIKPVFGNNITADALSKFEAEVILDPYATPESIRRGFEEAKNIIDEKTGEIDPLKIHKSTIFPAGQITVSKFEEFIEQHPEYEKTYKIWRKLLDEHTDMMLKNKNAYHIVSYNELRKLYDFLIKYRENKK